MFEFFDSAMKMQKQMLDIQAQQMKAWNSSVETGKSMLDAQKKGQRAMKEWASLWGVKL